MAGLQRRRIPKNAQSFIGRAKERDESEAKGHLERVSRRIRKFSWWNFDLGNKGARKIAEGIDSVPDAKALEDHLTLNHMSGRPSLLAVTESCGAGRQRMLVQARSLRSEMACTARNQIRARCNNQDSPLPIDQSASDRCRQFRQW